MCGYVYIFIYIYIYVCVCVSIYVCMHVCTYVCMYVCMYVYIQSDLGGICTICEVIVWVILSKIFHTNMGPTLTGYGVMGIFLIPVHSLKWTALTEPAGGCWLTVCIASITLPADSSTQLLTDQFPYLHTWEIRGRWGGYSPGYRLIVMLRQGTLCEVYSSWLRSVPVTTAWRVLRFRTEERHPIRRVAANKLNKKSRTADEGWSSSLGFGRGSDNPFLLKRMFSNTHMRDDSTGHKTIRR